MKRKMLLGLVLTLLMATAPALSLADGGHRHYSHRGHGYGHNHGLAVFGAVIVGSTIIHHLLNEWHREPQIIAPSSVIYVPSPVPTPAPHTSYYPYCKTWIPTGGHWEYYRMPYGATRTFVREGYWLEIPCQ